MSIIKRIWLLSALLLFILPVYAAKNITANPELQILSLSDIHFDPFLACGNNTPCPLIQMLRSAPATAWSGILAKHDATHPQYREDSDYSLLASALAEAKKVGEQSHAQAVLVLGDFLAHDFRKSYKKFSTDSSRESYRDFVHKTMMFLTNEVEKTFPHTNVYAVIGNNDSYRGNYRFDTQGNFLRDTAPLFAQLIKDPSNKAALRAQFPAAGYYAVTITPNTRLIALNTVLFSTKARPNEADSMAKRQLAWLHQELLAAKEKKQYVMLAMHIPAGVDVYATLKYRLFRMIQFWDDSYTNQFEAELKEFSSQMVAIFAGHLHSDWFQMLRIDNLNSIPVVGTPSISPVYGNNPGFKIFQYSSDDGKLKNFQTYYYPLNKNAGWGIEYSFDKIYQPNCRNCTLPDGIGNLTPSNQLADYYKYFYAVSTTSQPITTKWMPYYWCAIQTVNLNKYKNCVA